MQELPMMSRAKMPEASLLTYKGSRYNHFVTQQDGSKIIFNTVTNALSIMDEEAQERYNQFRVGALPNRDHQLDLHLIEGGYIVPVELDEIAHLKNLHLATKYDTTSWTMTICPTIACNFGCDYCFEVHKPGKMSIEVQAAIIRALESRANHLKDFSVTWYGGEPTIAWDVVQNLSTKIIEICDAHSIEYTANMISNGYLLDAEKVADLERYRISDVQITLDGNIEYHDTRRVLLSGKGTFERIVENLKHFLTSSVNASIRVNVDERNKNGVHALIDKLVDAGLSGRDNISMYFAAVTSTTEPSQGVIDHCMTRKGFSQLEVDFLDYAMSRGMTGAPLPSQNFAGCIAIRPEEYVVQADGELHKCWNTVGQSQYAVGHILDPQRNPLDSPLYVRWMAYDPFEASLGCSSCTWLPSYMGGCPYHAVYAEHDANSSEGVYLECTTFKYNFKRTLPMYVVEAEAGIARHKTKDFCAT
jgi:uncharacterized protein